MLETTRSAESAPQSFSNASGASRPNSASEPEEKSSHGFWSSLVDKVSDVVSAAKDWVCDAFGIGEEKKNEETLESSNNNTQPKTQVSLQHQKPYDVNDYHCDIKAYNKALDSGLDPRGQKGEIWDGNGMGVNQVFDLYPSGRSSVPQSNTKGYVFYDWENDGIYDHMEFYSAGSGAATYVSLPELGGIQ